ncbi:methionine gamma-lyase [Bacillus massiliglaciei]|uniref:methionine gamma-lyase n=1 Tax=Bacillus massiliglaciei TaxID=1816693 RepID=UPI000DA6336A|nr:methionine gamma-lyase [Bacillus massiliglaciei]
MGEKYQHIETAAIHGASDTRYAGSLVPPIFQTSTFVFDTAEQGEKRFSGQEDGYIYSRLGNPTVRVLEEKIALLEGGEAGLAFGSGMAAVSAVLLSLTKSGDHILCSKGVYGCTFGLLELLKEKYGISHNFCDMGSEEELRQAIRPETACIFIETPINPTMQLIDLEMAATVAKEYQIPAVVDNTFSTPYLQQPLQKGCDIVLHSATKYIGGHGDVVAGLVVGKKAYIQNLAATVQKDVGGILSPFDAWLLARGLKTLPVRMDRHSENAEKIVKKLTAHPRVKRVYFPGDTGHPQFEIAKKQMKAGGGLISFELKGTKEDAQAMLNRLKLIRIAVSLGDAETLIQHPATMTHSAVPADMRQEMGISDGLIRLSVGLEAWQDIWEDLEQALNG